MQSCMPCWLGIPVVPFLFFNSLSSLFNNQTHITKLCYQITYDTSDAEIIEVTGHKYYTPKKAYKESHLKQILAKANKKTMQTLTL